MRRSACLTVLSVALGVLAVAGPAWAVTEPTFELPMTSFRDLLVDSAHGHLFLTGGGSTGVVVRTLSGDTVTTILDQPGATGLALSPDGTRLYVALDQGDAISAIDTTTLTEVARYAVGAASCPRSLALTGTSLWFGYGCDAPNGSIGLLDLAPETPAMTLAKVTGYAVAPTLVAAGSAYLVAGEGSTLRSYPVDGTTLGTPATRGLDNTVSDLATTEDGLHVVLATGYPYYHPRYKVSDLSSDGVYGNQFPYPNSAATTGSYVAAGYNAYYDPDVRIYRGDGLLVRTYELGETLVPGGLAFAPGGGTLYAVTGDYANGVRHLHVLSDPTKTTTSITLTKPATAKINAAYTVTGSLAGAPGGATVHVRRTSVYGTKVFADVTTGSTGAFSFADQVSRRGTFTYTATYDGDAEHAAATRAVAFYVVGATPALTLASNATAYKYHAVATVTAHLGTTHGNRTVRIQATPYALGPTTLRTAAVNSSGNLAAAWTMSRKTTFNVYFAGDDVYEPRTVTLARGTYVALAEALSGYYTTSGSYRIYHKSTDPVLNTTVTPNRAGTCMAFLAQAYYSGAWHTIASNSCIPLSTGSHAAAVLFGTPATGIVYRMRATFAGDAYNLKTTGGWLSLKFTA